MSDAPSTTILCSTDNSIIHSSSIHHPSICELTTRPSLVNLININRLSRTRNFFFRLYSHRSQGERSPSSPQALPSTMGRPRKIPEAASSAIQHYPIVRLPSCVLFWHSPSSCPATIAWHKCADATHPWSYHTLISAYTLVPSFYGEPQLTWILFERLPTIWSRRGLLARK